MSDQLNEFIGKQHERDIVNAERYTRIETLLSQQSERLFGGPGQKGAITFLHEEHEELKREHAVTAKQVGSVISWKKGMYKWAAGAVFVLTAEGTALAFYFHNIAALIKAIPGHP